MTAGKTAHDQDSLTTTFVSPSTSNANVKGDVGGNQKPSKRQGPGRRACAMELEKPGNAARKKRKRNKNKRSATSRLADLLQGMSMDIDEEPGPEMARQKRSKIVTDLKLSVIPTVPTFTAPTTLCSVRPTSAFCQPP